MKKLKIILAVVMGLLIVAVGTIWILANPNRYRDVIEAKLESQLGRKVTLGDMSLGFFPFRFQVARPVIAESPAIGSQPFLAADSLDIRVSLLPLLRGNLQIDSIEITRPKVNLIRTKDGTWNFASLGGPPATPASPNPPASSQQTFSLDRLSIVDGQVGMTDLARNGLHSGYDHIDLELLHYADGRPFSFDMVAHIQGQAAQEMRLKGDAGPIVTGNPMMTPFHGKATLTSVDMDGLLRFLDTTGAPAIKGIASGESDVTSAAGTIGLRGGFKLDKGQINNLDLGYPISLEYQLATTVANRLLRIDRATLQLGATPLSLSGSLNTAAVPTKLDLRLQSGDASITEVARMAAAFGVAFGPAVAVTGRVRTDVHVTGTTLQPVISGSINGRDLRIAGSGVPQPVQIPAIDLALSPDAIRSSTFNATSGKTNVVGQFAVLQYASKSPSMDLSLKSSGATLPEIQSIARAYGIKGLDQIQGTGAMDFELRAKGPVDKLTTAAATRAINGTINLDFRPLQIAGFDAAHELGNLGGFGTMLSDKSSTEIVRLLGHILIKDGVAQSNDLKAELGIGNLAAAGTADLTTEQLDMKVSAVFTKAFSDKVGATRAGGFLNAALTNENGEIVLPALVTGTFEKPRFASDVKAIAQLQKQKYLPTLSNPASAIGNVLDAFKKKPAAPEGQPAAEPSPAGEKPSVVKGILGILGGKKNDASK